MAPNRYKPYLQIFVEDEANRDIVRGFLDFLEKRGVNPQYHIEDVCGGRDKVFQSFRDALGPFQKYQQRIAVLLVDFDGQPHQREDSYQELVPEELQSRVLLLGCRNHPERLEKRSYQYGEELAQECLDGTWREGWFDPEWSDNRERVQVNQNLLERVRSILGLTG